MSVARTPSRQQNIFIFALFHHVHFHLVFTLPPFSHPLLLSSLAHPIPQTNQFSCLPSMPAPTLSFVLCRDLHFQRPHVNLRSMLPSIYHNPPNSPFPPLHILLLNMLTISATILTITQFYPDIKSLYNT